MYNIQDILNNNNDDISQKAKKIRKKIALCHENIMNIANMFQSQVLSIFSVWNCKYKNRDLVEDINNNIRYDVRSMSLIKYLFKLDHYRNMDI